MSKGADKARDAPPDAVLAAALFAVDPVGTGGVRLRALAGPVREQWLVALRAGLPASAPWRRLPLHATDDRLIGGLDLAATLRAGRPVAERGLLAEADGGVLVLAMAERLTLATAARLAAVLDTGAVVLERDGLAAQSDSRFGIVALDEGMADDEAPPGALLDRLAFHVNLDALGAADVAGMEIDPDVIARARKRLPGVAVGADAMQALCAAALALGIASLRPSILALRVARAAAALDGRDAVSEADILAASRLVLAPRATVVPMTEPSDQEEAPEQPDPPDNPQATDETQPDEPQSDPTDQPEMPLDEVVLAAAQASIPDDLLARLSEDGRAQPGARASGRSQAAMRNATRGRPMGVRAGKPQAGARLNLIETLRAAAPWQRIRRTQMGLSEIGANARTRVQVRGEDFRIRRFKHAAQTTTIFIVDASGSSAYQRLAEAKGAVELLLADCYVRRDKVALIAFRGTGAELLLPPTRSLVRAKRSLAGLPGGGGTPLANGIEAGARLADEVKRMGDAPVVIVMTDGRANIARDGTADRARAKRDAEDAAHLLKTAGIRSLLVDTAPRPQDSARHLAAEMGAHYRPLPHATAGALTDAVRDAGLTAPA